MDQPGLYLIVEFEWPQPFQAEYGEKARVLHKALKGQTWVREVLAASGGVGGGAASIWVFWLENYAALDRLLQDVDDPIGDAYRSFFTVMNSVTDRIREEVVFSD